MKCTGEFVCVASFSIHASELLIVVTIIFYCSHLVQTFHAIDFQRISHVCVNSVNKNIIKNDNKTYHSQWLRISGILLHTHSLSLFLFFCLCVNGVNFTSLNIIERKHLINVGNGNSNYFLKEQIHINREKRIQIK